ncbi:MAG: hypothetical protein ACRDRZ_12310 [Pseudonocardiaceae bacterium]
MTRPLPDDDEQLLVELGNALRSAGPITERDLEQGRAAFAWRTVDEELALALLVYDSSIQESLLMRAGATPGARTLVFEGRTASVEVAVTPDAVTGQLVPPGRATVALMTVGGAVGETTADDLGGFAFTAPPSGPVRLLCRTQTTSLVTDWIRL